MATIPRARYLANGDVELHFPYDALLVDSLKFEIPTYARRYNPDDKTWTIEKLHAAHGEHLLRWRFPDARIERPDAEPSRGVDPPFAVLHLLPTAPPELIEGRFGFWRGCTIPISVASQSACASSTTRAMPCVSR